MNIDKLSHMLFVATCLFVILMTGECQAEVQGSHASIIVHTDNVSRKVPALLFGSNLQWTSNGDGLIRVDKMGHVIWLQDALALARAAHISAFRFPGGSLANTYRWKEGIGATQNRKQGLNYAGDFEPSTFGSVEYIKLLNRTKTDGIITVNVDAGVNEAADWVEYFNGNVQTKWGKVRALDGFSQPVNVMNWEIGNELFSPNMHGHISAKEYAKRAVQFIKAMKKRVPDIKIGVHLETAFQKAAWIKSVYPHLLTWNEEVLRIAGPHIDFVSLHFYAPFDHLWNEDDLHKLVWAAPVVFERTVDQVKEILKKYAGEHVRLGLTEYSTFFGGKVRPDKRIASVENALFVAMMLISVIKDESFFLANYWSFINNSAFGMLTGAPDQDVVKRPVFTVFEALGKMAGARVVQTLIHGDGYMVVGKGNVPNLDQVNYLVAAAVINQSRELMVAVVNRSPSKAVSGQLLLPEAQAVGQWNIASFIANKDGSAWKRTIVDMKNDKRMMAKYVFPAQSLTILKVGLAQK